MSSSPLSSAPSSPQRRSPSKISIDTPSSPLSSAPSSPRRQSPSKRRLVKPSRGPPNKKMRAIDQETPVMPKSTTPKEKITCFCGMTLRPAGLDIHLKTHHKHNSAHSASSSSEDEYPTAPTMTIPRQTTGGKSFTKHKANEVSNADASPATERRIAPLPSRAQVLVPSPQPQAPAAPPARTKPRVRGPKIRMTRRQYYYNLVFGSSGDETVSTGSDTEYEGEYKDGPVEHHAGGSNNEVDMREHHVEEERPASYQDVHPLEPAGYAADGSASEDSDDSDDYASSYSPSPRSLPAPLPAEPVEPFDIPQVHPEAYHQLEPIDDWMYGPASEDSTDSDDDGSSSSSSSSSSPSSPLTKPAPLPVEPVGPVEPVPAPQPGPDVADMDVDSDVDSLFSASDSDIYGD